MPRGKSTASIPPFPDSIDRNHFGSWLSGLIDGEGSFGLQLPPNRKGAAGGGSPRAFLQINLRDDDAPVLSLVQQYWRCGTFSVQKRCEQMNKPHPCLMYRVVGIRELKAIILPHFDRFPLLAKKKRDLAIWREGVELIATVACRRRQGGRGRWGVRQKWTPREIAHFLALRQALADQRQYQAPPPVVPVAPQHNSQLQLWPAGGQRSV